MEKLLPSLFLLLLLRGVVCVFKNNGWRDVFVPSTWRNRVLEVVQRGSGKVFVFFFFAHLTSFFPRKVDVYRDGLELLCTYRISLCFMTILRCL